MRLRYLTAFLCIVVSFVAEHAFAQAKPIGFEREVLPLLEKHCNECHHPAETGGGLDLTGVSEDTFHHRLSLGLSIRKSLSPEIDLFFLSILRPVQVLHERSINNQQSFFGYGSDRSKTLMSDHYKDLIKTIHRDSARIEVTHGMIRHLGFNSVADALGGSEGEYVRSVEYENNHAHHKQLYSRFQSLFDKWLAEAERNLAASQAELDAFDKEVARYKTNQPGPVSPHYNPYFTDRKQDSN